MQPVSRQKTNKTARLLMWVERIFLVLGGVAFGWCGFILGEAYLTQRVARHSLEATPPRADSSEAAPQRPAPDMRTVRNGTPLALLSIPRLGLSTAVLQGSDEYTLRLGLGHIEDTAWLGETGNVAIAGHRDSFFRPLRNIRVGDDILVETPGNRAHYRVSWFRVVGSNDVGVIAPTSEATLTLVTCYPFWFIGSAPDRFVVRATRVDTSPMVKLARAEALEPPPLMPLRAPARAATAHIMPPDDDTLVRQALEGFRTTYNARLAKHGDRQRLTFSGCQIAVTGTTAAATCRLVTAPANTSQSWTFVLNNLNGPGSAWTIKSVTMD